MNNYRVYLDNAATTIPRESVLDAATEYINRLRDFDMSSNEIIEWTSGITTEARKRVADLIGSSPSEIAFVKSTSQALGTIACSLPLKKGDNVLVCDLEYQASTACWNPRAGQLGVEIRRVKTACGQITAEDFEKNADDNTKAILIASVQEINGFRADLKAISEYAHSNDILLIVDGIQEVGALSVDVKDIDADFYCAGGKKWLGNPFGMGFMYIRKDLLNAIKPPYYSYIDTVVPDKYYDDVPTVMSYLSYLEDPERSPFDAFGFKKDATVFESGGFDNYIGLVGLAAAIREIDDIGIEEIEHINKERARFIGESLEALGYKVTSPTDDEHRSAIVTFSVNDLEQGDVSAERELTKRLADNNIYVSLRCAAHTGGIRISPHWFTPDDDIERFLELL